MKPPGEIGHREKHWRKPQGGKEISSFVLLIFSNGFKERKKGKER